MKKDFFESLTVSIFILCLVGVICLTISSCADQEQHEEIPVVSIEIPVPEQKTEIAPVQLKVQTLEEEKYYDSLELLAICVEAEAGNQDIDGKRMVVDVILNRVDDANWPDTVQGVITQPYQFGSYWDGGMDRVYEPAESTYEAVRMELKKRGWPEIYYFTAGDYGKYGTPWKQVGDHYFCTK